MARRRPRVYLHIGAMKTGTTYLQELMADNRDALARAGFLFPGQTWAQQDRAARDVLEFSTVDYRIGAQSKGMWDRLTAEMLAHRGKGSLYSMEFLSFADEERASRIVESLAGADVHVILTVRDAGVVIPTQWATSCRNTGKVPWPAFVNGVRQVLESPQPRGRAARLFQRTQGIPRMLEVWAPLVGAERLHVITVPPRGSDPRLLWERFASVVGVDPAVCPPGLAYANPSLGHASTELLRRINVELGPVVRSDYDRVVKARLARTVLGSRAALESPIVLHRKGRRLAARWNRRVRTAIRESGVHLVGSLQELPVAPPDDTVPATLRQPTTEELLAAGATARDGLLALQRELLAELQRPAGASEDAPTAPERWTGEPQPEQSCASELAALARVCMELTHEIDAPAAQAPAG
jgi:hypothetical protein